MELTKSQKEALDWLHSWSLARTTPVAALTGPAGSGKTTLLNTFLRSRSATLLATTGKAALRAGELSGVPASTVHSQLYGKPEVDRKRRKLYFYKVRPKPSGASLIVVDEASMLGPQVFEDLKTWTHDGHCQVLLVGDPYQLSPVLDSKEEAAPDYMSTAGLPGPMLREVMRNAGPIVDAATRIREEHRIPDSGDGAFRVVRDKLPNHEALRQWGADPEDHTLLTWRNAVRTYLNRGVRKRLGLRGALEPGEPFLVCKNGQGVFNGEILKLEACEPTLMTTLKTHVIHTACGKRLHAYLGKMDGVVPYLGRDKWFDFIEEMAAYNLPDPVPITHAYCLTAHKAQGSEFRRGTVVLGREDFGNPHFQAPTQTPSGLKPFWVRWLYTAVTRAKEQVTLVGSA